MNDDEPLEPTLDEAIEHLKLALDEAGRNMAANTVYHAEQAAEEAKRVVNYRVRLPAWMMRRRKP